MTTAGRYEVRYENGDTWSFSAESLEAARSRATKTGKRVARVALVGRGYASLREHHQANCAHAWEETCDGAESCGHCGATRRRRT